MRDISPKTLSTKENIITLVSLRYALESVRPKDVARFLGITERQARTILNEMVLMGIAQKEKTQGWYYISSTTEKGYEVICHIMNLILQARLEQMKKDGDVT
ncbi:MAG: hypothetical protein DRP11_01390 [Candidatus Aenigmatarchaeota archaeon]|nr:MAG: hypothetical protein DRP11_01390 [Candidatus Aenigmarchaeota archaeon]